MTAVAWKYRLGPFVLESEIDLPELTALTGQGTADVSAFIRLGVTPERIEGVVANESRWWASRDEYLQRVPGVASFLVRQGREIIVQPADGALAGDIRAYLLAPIFSALCYQAGMYALHASSVQVGDGVVAFLGNSGAGKSTLAACMERRGHGVVSDDLCLLDTRQGAAESVVVPVAPALKLWGSAVDHLGVTKEGLTQVFSRDDKFRMRIGQSEARLPLREVVFLEWGDQVEFVPIQGVEAVTRLMEHTHFDYLMKPTGRQAANFIFCGRILSEVGAFVLRRPKDFGRLEAVLDAVEMHLAGEWSGAGEREGQKRSES